MKRLLGLATVLIGLLLIDGTLHAQQKGVQPLVVRGKSKASSPAFSKETAKAFGKLKGKWIVRSVQRDGKPNAAQIGQKTGDIITIAKRGATLALG